MTFVKMSLMRVRCPAPFDLSQSRTCNQQHYGAFTLNARCPNRVPALLSCSVDTVATDKEPFILKNQSRKFE